MLSIKDQKKALRKEVLTAIGKLPAQYTETADAAIVKTLLTLPEYAAARTVFCFVGSDHEIGTTPFLESVLSQGKRLCVPLCTGKGIMEAREITALSQLEPGYYGLLEPKQDTPIVSPEEIDLAVIPCVSCNHDGVRLGHGGGFYDIYFTKNRQIPCVMICREQVMRDAIPREDHDLPFSVVVSEDGVFRS